MSQFSKIPKVNVLGRISGFFRFYPDLSGFIRILISCPNFFLKKDNIFFVKNLYFFLLFLGFSAKISTKNLVPIFENSQGQCPRKDFRIFPVLSGFIRILISCPNFFLKKDNIFFLFFVKNLYFFLLFLGFSAKITKNLVPIFENSQGQCPRRFFWDFRFFPDLSGKIRIFYFLSQFLINFLFLFFCKKFI